MNKRKDRLVAYARRLASREPESRLETMAAAGRPGVEEMLPRPVTPEDRVMQEAALEGWRSLQADRDLSEGQMDALEAIILPTQRPVIDIINDTFHDPGPMWSRLNQEKPKIEAAIRAVGRLEIEGYPGLSYGGTGFLVGPGLIMTNRHVAELFVEGVGRRRLKFFPGRTASLDLKEEIVPSEPIILEVQSALMVHPYWDAALMRVKGIEEREPLRLAAAEPANLKGRTVVVIGYPAFDPRSDVSLQFRIFRGIFERKRLQPGRSIGYRSVRSYDATVEALAHDCSTLGGNSGSCLVDVDTGEVLGLHFAGVYLEANYTVPSWQLALDPRVVDLGVRFSPHTSAGAHPEWIKAWEPYESLLDTVTAPDEPKKAEGPAVLVHESPLLEPDWYERSDDARIASALRRDPEGTRAFLNQALGAEEAAEVVQDLTDNDVGTEGLFDPEPDPALPEIVLLHGIAGGHLDRQGGLIDQRVWLNPLWLVFDDVSANLSLAPDGDTEANGRRSLVPAGHLRIVYSRAPRKWRSERFVVHAFSFDWRKGMTIAADRLADFLEQLHQRRPGKPVVLVGHSMGGLVSCLYAQRHSGWTDRVQKAIFMGSPLGGSFAALDAVIGTFPMLRQMDLVSLRNDLNDLRRMWSTMPGLSDMLPAPQLFNQAERLYGQAGWPDGIIPLQRWLDQSRNLKSLLLNSPLLERTTLLVSLGHGTVSSFSIENGTFKSGPRTGVGDGTVPGKAAAIKGVPAFKVDKDHSFLPTDTKAIRAVVSLIKTGATNLEPVRPEDLSDDIVLPESVPLETPQEAVESVKARFREGRLRSADVRWLLSPQFEKIPEA